MKFTKKWSGRMKWMGVGIGIWLGIVVVVIGAEGPAGWVEQGVLKEGAAADDYAVVNQGQLKTIAVKAYRAMVEVFGEGEVSDGLTEMIEGWNNVARADDYAVANLGQAKVVAKPFYDQLGLAYPWANSTRAADDYALVNIGQVKWLFSFELSLVDPNRDVDGNGISDWWEQKYFGRIGVDPFADEDGDGVNNLLEYLLGFNPKRAAQDDVDESFLQVDVHIP